VYTVYSRATGATDLRVAQWGQRREGAAQKAVSEVEWGRCPGVGHREKYHLLLCRAGRAGWG
jgi:hypothetical protein